MKLKTATLIAVLSLGSSAALAVESNPARAIDAGVAKGLDQFDRTYTETGMAGLQEAVEDCYAGYKRSPALGKLAQCAATDKRAHDIDYAFTRQYPMPPSRFFVGNQPEKRLRAAIKRLKADNASVEALLAAIRGV